MAHPRAIIDLREGVECRHDVLTWQHSIRFDDVECRLVAPGPYPAWAKYAPVSTELEPPRDEHGFTEKEWPTSGWGRITSEESVCIEALGLEFDAAPPSGHEALLRFDRVVAQFVALYRTWLMVLADGPTHWAQAEIGAGWLSSELMAETLNARYANYETWEPRRLTHWEWNHAFQHAGAGEDAPLGIKHLALATRDAWRGDTRSAILNAATAAECALTEGLLRHLSDANSIDLAQEQLDQHRMLGRRLQLAEKQGLSVPAQARADLVEPRNAAIHAGSPMDVAIAWRAIGVARSIVEDFDPLPDHCREPLPDPVDSDEPDPRDDW